MDGAQLPITLKECLENIGFQAELELPDPSTYTYCCGLFVDIHAKTYQARLTTLLLINWLNTLARRGINDDVLMGALILAEKFLKLHRDAMGEMVLFKEIELAKERYEVEDKPEYFDELQDYSKGEGHRNFPNIIKEYLKAHPEHQKEVEIDDIKITKSHYGFWTHFICCGDETKEQDQEKQRYKQTARRLT